MAQERAPRLLALHEPGPVEVGGDLEDLAQGARVVGGGVDPSAGQHAEDVDRGERQQEDDRRGPAQEPDRGGRDVGSRGGEERGEVGLEQVAERERPEAHQEVPELVDRLGGLLGALDVVEQQLGVERLGSSLAVAVGALERHGVVQHGCLLGAPGALQAAGRRRAPPSAGGVGLRCAGATQRAAPATPCPPRSGAAPRRPAPGRGAPGGRGARSSPRASARPPRRARSRPPRRAPARRSGRSAAQPAPP